MSLRIVVPFSNSDAHLMDGFVDLLALHKTIDNHYLTLVPTKSQGEIALKAAAKIRSFCPNVTVEQMPDDPEGGWPIAPNRQFAWTVYMLQRIGNSMPWFWMELDCVPMRKFWADELASEYAMKKKPYMGHVRKVPSRDQAGNPADGDENMMIGCAVYPHDILSRSTLMQDLMSAKCPSVGFDIYLSQEQQNPSYGGMAHTNLIQDAWNTHRYELIKGTYLGESAPSQFVARARGGPVDKRACIVHGVKDGSLGKLLMLTAGGRIESAAATFYPEAKEQFIPSEVPVKIEPSFMFDQFKAYMEREFLPLVLEKLKPEPYVPHPSHAVLWDETVKVNPPKEEVAEPPKEQLPLDIIKDKLTAKHYRLNALADEMKMDKEELRNLLDYSGEFFVSGPAQWINRK